MNINKWLCKYFDYEDKGYVTIGDVIKIIFVLFSVLFLIVAILYSIGSLFASIINPNYEGNIITAFVYVVYLVVVVIMALVGLTIIYYISEIKIAKCPLKEKKE